MLMAPACLVALAGPMLALSSFAETTGTADTDESIRAAWSEVDAAWNARDVERFSRLFSEDATFYFVVRDDLLDGRSRIHARFAEQFRNQSPELRHLTEVRRVQPLERGVAAVDLEVRVVRHAGDAAEPAVVRRFAVFALMYGSSDAWEIRGVRIYPLPLPGDAE